MSCVSGDMALRPLGYGGLRNIAVGSGESGKEAGQKRSRFSVGFSKASLSAVFRMERMEAEGPKREQ